MQGDLTSLAILSFQKALAKVKPQTSTAMKSAIVALYTADAQGKLRYSGLIGLLQIDIDRLKKSKFLRIYELESMSLCFEVQIYYGFQKNYRSLTDTVYIFEYPKGTIAFQFKTPMEAELMKAKIFSNCPSLEEFEEVKKRNNEAARKKEQQQSFFGKIKNFFGGQKQKEQHQSQILSFKKQTSISFNLSDGTFNTQNIPPEWQEVFNSLNLTNEDLNNKEVMGVIIQQTILNQARREADQQSNKDLQKKVQLVERQTKQQNDIPNIQNLYLPPPPPLTILSNQSTRMSTHTGSKRTNLMDEIRNNNLKLKHVQVNTKEGNGQISVDISDMNKEERSDHIENLRKKLQMRKKALNRRQDDDD